MHTILLVVLVLDAVALVGLILLQQGKGADVGAAFGSGASQTVFGSRGSGSFLTRATAVLATLFFIVSLALAYVSGQTTRTESIMDETATEQAAPAEPAPAEPAPADNQAPSDVPADVPTAPSGDVPQ